MTPPLRTEDDRQALLDGLRDGTIDCVATDHAPHAAEEKEMPFEEAAWGVTGLETAFAALHTDLVLPGVLPLELLVERMTSGGEPFGIAAPRIEADAVANLALIDPGLTWTVGEEGYESRSHNNCYAGRELTGRVLMTVADGRVAFRQRSFAMGVASEARCGSDRARRHRRTGGISQGDPGFRPGDEGGRHAGPGCRDDRNSGRGHRAVPEGPWRDGRRGRAAPPRGKRAA